MEDVNDDLFVIVPKWERFQHYHDRDPVWIKVYTNLLHNPAYRQLSLASRGLLQVIWLGYASSSFRLCVGDVRSLVGTSKGIGLQLISLRDAGFIDLSASALLATKKEKEVEVETPLPPLEETRKNAASAKRVRNAERWIANGNASHYPPERLGEIIADEFGIEDGGIVAALVQRIAEADTPF